MSVNIQKLIDLAGDVLYDNVYDAKAVIENFCSENIAIISTNRAVDITQGTHLHDNYEFDICQTDIPSTVIENRIFNRSNNTLFAINPMQEHELISDLKGFSICGLLLIKALYKILQWNYIDHPILFFQMNPLL